MAVWWRLAVRQQIMAEEVTKASFVAGMMEAPVVKMMVVVVGAREMTAAQMLVSVRLMRVTALVGTMEEVVRKMGVVVGVLVAGEGMLGAGVGMVGAWV